MTNVVAAEVRRRIRLKNPSVGPVIFGADRVFELNAFAAIIARVGKAAKLSRLPRFPAATMRGMFRRATAPDLSYLE
jgi:hypothetical protein